MSLNDLAPANRKRARESAVRSFMKFLEEEGVRWDYLEVCMQRESAPLVLEAVVDKFGMYLAFKEGRKGQVLARHSVMQYYRQTKNWLLEQFPQHRVAIDKTLLKKGQKALKKVMLHVYSTAVTTADYQDVALLCLLWYLFGRALDLTLLRKVNLSIGSGDIFFVRFIRVRTSEEQGLSQFPDFSTYPLLAVALALVTQTSPTSAVLSQLPEQHASSQAALTPATPLIDLLDQRSPNPRRNQACRRRQVT
ncbi:hypothetical protein PF004_g17580 [Phytophthora fragariae]|uniref:Uncharacterized protein n=1 Tax=Phytophthora fragariae TaxID=53985 RepID=A0A6G0NF17_9STRA|nr:hypothetical protein PF004_g17580 [Phytophthora fragariae]